MLTIHDTQRVITGKVRFAQLKLNAGALDLITVLIPKTDLATKRKIDAAVHGAIEEGVRGRWKDTNCLTVISPVVDGDAMEEEGCRAHWVLTAAARPSEQPGMVTQDFEPIRSARDLSAGMYGRVSMYFTAENTASGTGIGVYVKNIQKLEDGAVKEAPRLIRRWI